MILPMAVVSGDVKGALLYFYQGNWTVLMALIVEFGGAMQNFAKNFFRSCWARLLLAVQ